MAFRHLHLGVLQSRRQACVLGIALAGITTAPLACSGPSAPAAPAPTVTLGGSSAHAIHLYAKRPDGSRVQLDFGQGTELSLGGTQAAGAGLQSHLLDHHVSVEGILPDAGPLQTPPTVDAPGSNFLATAWALVVRAALDQCRGGSVVLPWSVSHDFGQYWYEYQLSDGCTDRIFVEGSLVCVADKLAEVADAVGDVVWPASPGTVCSPYVYGEGDGGVAGCDLSAEWDIPPQADSDRFIVRDLAIHTLSMLPTLDAYTDLGGVSCAASLASVAGGQLDPTPFSGQMNRIFGVTTAGSASAPEFPRFPPWPTPFIDASGASHAPEVALAALLSEAETLRSGGRLLHDLIRRDVYSDLASAAKQSAKAANPARGNELAWGISSTQDSYGSISHAARVLMGRWEIGDSADFPNTYQLMPEGVAALNLVGGAFGPDLTARTGDLPIRTPGEATASKLVEEAGIVLPSCQMADASSAASLEAALIDQLLTQEQARNGLKIDPSSPQRGLYERLVGGLSGPEVVAAFQRTLNTYRLLTNSGDPANPMCARPVAVPTTDPLSGLAVNLPGGLLAVNPALVAPSVTGLHGIVIAGGIARSRLSTDPMARAGGMLEASQAPEADGLWTEWGTPSTTSATDASSQPYTLPPANYQDAFHVGQAFERRLVLLEAAANAPGVLAQVGQTGSSPEAVARGAIAELRTWAGSTIVHAWAERTDANALVEQVRIAGLQYSDLGITQGMPVGPALAATFGFVYGPPWMAECAAHVRADCPAGFDVNYIQQPGAVADLSPTPTSPGTFGPLGVVDTVFQFSVPLFAQGSPPPSGYAPQFGQASNGLHLYMVRLHDPSDPAGHGHVMGTIPLPRAPHFTFPPPPPSPVLEEITSFVDAPMQRELVHDALDLGKWVGAAPPKLGDPSTAQTSGYCVDGVPRDLFVPLDNELTSSSTAYDSSWQHYLDLANQAATTADGLGQALIADDLQISENEQAAGEQLADLCGDFGMLSTVTVAANGTTSAGANDPTLSSCLSEPLTDVVFLGDVPNIVAHPYVPGSDPTCWLKQYILQCPSDPSDASCASAPTPVSPVSPLCSKASLTMAGLGIVKPAPSPSGSAAGDLGDPLNPFTGACDSLIGLTSGSSVQSTFAKSFQGTSFLKVLQDPAFAQASIERLASSLKMNVDLLDNWTVTYGGETVMSSSDPAFWPACLNANGCIPKTQTPAAITAYAVAQALNNTFRMCQSGSQTQALGCDGLPGMARNISAEGELNLLKWRVMQAMWMIATAQGVVPQGMFTLPVPVVAQDGSSLRLGWVGSYPGQLVGTGTDAQTNLKTWHLGTVGTSASSSADSLALGTVYDVAPAFTAFTFPAVIEIPSWILPFYTNAPDVKHALVTNPETLLGVTPLNWGWLDHCGEYCQAISDPQGTPLPVPVSLYSLLASADRLDTIACPPYGEPTAGPIPLSPVPGFNTDGFGGPKPPSNWPQFWSLAVSSYTQTPIEAKVNLNPYFDENSGGQGNIYRLVGGNRAVNWETSSTTGTPVPPSVLSPTDRSPDFIGAANTTDGTWVTAANSIPRGGATCGALSSLLQAATLVCVANPATAGAAAASAVVPGTTVPAMTSTGSIPLLEAWLDQAGGFLANNVGGIYATSIPTRVVNDFTKGTVGSGDIAGAKGQAILDLEQAMQTLPSDWTEISRALTGIKGAISSARLAIDAANLQDKAQNEQIEMQNIQVQGQMAQALDSFLQTAVGAAANWQSYGASTAVIPFAAMALSDATQTGNAEESLLTKEQATADDVAANQVAQALAQLDQTTSRSWDDVQTHMDAVRADVAKVLAAAQTIQGIMGKASYQAAIGTGADFVTTPSGQEVPIPVNTVLRRQASATEQRYQTALVNAKALAYMARRAIEQRIGVPLDSITTGVGPLEAPASWADDICSLQGVNYASLSKAVPSSTDGGGIGGSADTQAINAFADGWVGDYVAKLQEFVTYYNTQYPSHQGSDTAVLSLRSDLLDPLAQCSSLAPNLLIESGDLSTLVDPTVTLPGWRLSPCTPGAGSCLAVLDGVSLASPQDGPNGAMNGEMDAGEAAGLATGITWLTDVAQPQVDAGAADATAPDAAGAPDGGGIYGSDGGSLPPASSPPSLVSQSVNLDTGTYVLSWWDQARDVTGAVVYAPASAVSYVARVYDASWNVVTTFYDAPYKPDASGASTPSLWSPRRTLSFAVSQPGTYYVAFGASAGGGGSVAIANVQLEVAAAGQPTAYIATGASRMVTALACPRSDGDLRAAFQHNCDPNGACSYDLDVPLIIDTGALNANQSPLDGKLAAGNYNFRHTTLAVNLVGTGVHDCSNNPTPNCYGTGYIEYNLEHDATNAGIVGYDGNARIFDFGVATVQHGKALAAERYLTMPLSSNDQALVSQPGIEHQELSGRPIDGAYRLRIWDSPALHWNQLQDVQIVLQYDYWSQIQTSTSANMSLRRNPLAQQRGKPIFARR